jgi:Skp family chaperone for outer membrane proteins
VNAITRRILLQRTDLLAKHGPEKVMNAIDEVADFVGDVEEIGSSDVSAFVKQVEQKLGGIEESALQAYLGNKKYGEKGMDKLRAAGRNHASKKKMQNIRAEFSNKEKAVAEGYTSSIEGILAAHPEAVENFKQGGDLDYDLESDLWDYYFNNGDIRNYDADATEFISQSLADELGLREGLDANQKRVGQLGPTEKVKNNNIGKLVGANENFINTDAQAVVTEVDTGEYDARKSGSKGETTPEQEKDFRKKVQTYGKELEQRQKEKEKVKEGQDDLAAMLRIINR